MRYAIAIAVHIEGLIEDGLPVPPSTAQASYVEIATNEALRALAP